MTWDEAWIAAAEAEQQRQVDVAGQIPYDEVREYGLPTSLIGLEFIESVKRKPGPRSRTNPIRIVCKEGHETGLSVALGTGEGNLVLVFRARDNWKGRSTVYQLDHNGSLGRGREDHSRAWRLFCAECQRTSGARSPEWVASEALLRLRHGLGVYSETGQWPRLHMSWT